jgi:hypothetical protein
MDLWHGSVVEFVREAELKSLGGSMAAQYFRLHGCLPSDSEMRSWDNSLFALAQVAKCLRGNTAGAAGSDSHKTAGPPAVLLEYHLPLNGKRLDAVFVGHDESGQATAVVIELKQWSRVDREDDCATTVTVGGEEVLHPCEQSHGYAEWLNNYHSAFTDHGYVAASCAYCHELAAPHDAPLRHSCFRDLLSHTPLFVRGEQNQLVAFLQQQVGAGGGIGLLPNLSGANFRPSKRVLDNLEAVLDSREEWQLLDEQRVAYNSILDEVRRQQSRAGRTVVIVRGAPGTGKTVVALQLLASCLRLGWKAAHATGGKAFTTTLRSKFKGAENLFIWNMHTRKAPPQGLDLLLVDEAHRVRETSDTRFTPASERNKRSQTKELIDASKVCVFLLDENQSVRPDEVGSTTLLRDEAAACRARIKEFDLATQFRCGGCSDYIAWVDWLLGFSETKPSPWRDRYRVDLAQRPQDLDKLLEDSQSNCETARIVAGFCWKWSDPTESGALIADVAIDEWQRPWNRKPKENKQYKPAEHPYTLWAETDDGLGQIGCIYSAQGFEFSRIGVIWGNDLVWRGSQWCAQKAHSHDRPVRSSPEMLALVRNAYRVLLTRGLRNARLLILDEETKQHVCDSLAGMQ